LLLKITDKLGLETHSTFSYKKNDSFRYFGYKSGQHTALQIIKPTGEIVDIDLEELDKNANKEVALPNLEIGDIIDYTRYTEDTDYGDCFPSVIESLSRDYLIVNGYRRIKVDRGIFINYKALHGAPQLEKNEELSDRRKLVYELNFDNIAPRKAEAWSPDLRTEPSYKLSMCYGPISRTDHSDEMLVDPYNVTYDVSREKKKITISNINVGGLANNDPTWKQFQRWYRGTYKDVELTKSEFMEVAYYYLRYYTVIFNPLLNSYVEDYHSSYVKFSFFLRFMIAAASDRQVDYRVVYTNNKNISEFKDVIMSSELNSIFAYLDDEGQWQYIETPTAYQTMDFINPYLRGQKGLAKEWVASGRRHIPAEMPIEVTVPTVDPEHNYYNAVFTMSPDLEAREVKVTVNKNMTGNQKYYNSKLFLKNTDYHEEAETSMLRRNTEDRYANSGRRERGKKRTIDYVEGKENEKLREMKKLWEDEEFELVSYDSFELINSGVKTSQDTLKVIEEFTVSDLFQKVGPNVVFNIGKIALDQISFTDEEMADRSYDVFFDYPKKLEYKYVIDIPEGYEVKGYEALNVSGESDYGKTKMKAGIVDNQLVIELNKTYMQQYAPKEEWSRVMDFITPAMKINEAKIVFSKIS
ncbi:MAG TPA: hypothetical protein VJ949_14660, partial [Cryomorphaceae bacterium]|nr:hypothetical protein [Cryomorphaceae bacterium]